MMKKVLLLLPRLCMACVLCCITSLTSLQAADHNIFPEKVTDLVATWDSSTECVTVSMTAPTHSMKSLGSGNGEPLPYLTKVILSRNLNYGDYTEIHTFEDIQPGDVLTYIDMTATAGLYQYKAVAYIDDYASYPEWYEIQVGQFPADINDAYATCNKGEAPVTLIFTAPSTDSEGATLKSLDKIEVLRYSHNSYSYELIGTIDNPTPGEKCTYDDNNVISGESYSYRLVPYASAGSAYGTLVEVSVSLDAPTSPRNVTAKYRNGSVAIEWQAPIAGQTNGYIDPLELTYKVLRSETGSEYDSELLVEDCMQGFYWDNGTFDKECKYTYYVRAVNAQGESVGVASNPVVVGPASQLPYIETFDSLTEYDVNTTDHPGWMYSSSETACAWNICNVVEMEERSIATESGNGGLAVAMYGPYNDREQDDYMTTAPIVADADNKYALKLRYYAFEGCNNTLAIEITTDGKTYTQVGCIDYEGTAQEGWESYSMPLSEYVPYGTEKIQVRLHAHKGTLSQPVIIDDFVIDRLSSVEQISYDVSSMLIQWEEPQSHLALTGYVVVLNGSEIVTLSPDNRTYNYSQYQDESYLVFEVCAVYEGRWYSRPSIVNLSALHSVEVSQGAVSVQDDTLCVDTAEGTPVVVYAMSGQVVYHGIGSCRTPLHSGIYLVKVGSEVHKIAI